MNFLIFKDFSRFFLINFLFLKNSEQLKKGKRGVYFHAGPIWFVARKALDNQFDQHDNEDENLESWEEPMPSWARTLLENEQSFTIQLDQIDHRIKKLESPDESDFWEDNSPQIEIPEEPINDHLNFSNFVHSNDYYPKDRNDYQYEEVRVGIPMIKEVDDPKEYFNMDMTRSLPKTIQCINPTPRSNRIIRCHKCWKVGHVKANRSKLIIVMDDSNPLHMEII